MESYKTVAPVLLMLLLMTSPIMADGIIGNDSETHGGQFSSGSREVDHMGFGKYLASADDFIVKGFIACSSITTIEVGVYLWDTNVDSFTTRIWMDTITITANNDLTSVDSTGAVSIALVAGSTYAYAFSPIATGANWAVGIQGVGSSGDLYWKSGSGLPDPGIGPGTMTVTALKIRGFARVVNTPAGGTPTRRRKMLMRGSIEEYPTDEKSNFAKGIKSCVTSFVH